MSKKQRAFIMKYQDFYTHYNHGCNSKQRKRCRRVGLRIMRTLLKREMQEEIEDMQV